MKEKKIWFKGFSSRFWIPISIEGWLTTVLFFVGIILIAKINNTSSGASLTFSQMWPVIIEFAVLLGIFYFLTKGHVDKKY